VSRFVRLPALMAIALIRLYQGTLARLLSARCRFHPTCSEYTVQAIEANGVFFGVAAGAWRILRCGPWSAGGPDPVKVRPARREIVRG